MVIIRLNNTGESKMSKSAHGYYTVLVEGYTPGAKIPYIVQAASDYHAARIVKAETGYIVNERDVEGPY